MGHPVVFVHVVVHRCSGAVHHLQACAAAALCSSGTVSVVTSRALSTPSPRAEAQWQRVAKGADLLSGGGIPSSPQIFGSGEPLLIISS